MDLPDVQPAAAKPRNLAAYVAIVVAACAAAGALGLLARSFLRPSDAVARLLPSVNTVLFVRSTDLSDMGRWTANPLLRDPATGSGSTTSGSSLSGRINALHARVSRETEAFVDAASTPPTAVTAALVSTATAGPSLLVMAEFSDEGEAVSTLSGLRDARQKGEAELREATGNEIRSVRLGSGAIGGFATRIGNVVAFSREQAAVRSILSTSADGDLSLSATRGYSAGRLARTTGYQVYVDYPKAVAILKGSLQSERAWRDVFVLLAPLESNVSGIHATLGREASGYRLRAKVIMAGKGADALLGLPEDPAAPALPGGPEVLVAVTGHDLLHGYRRFSAYLGTTEPDSNTVLEALSRFLLATYVTPRLSPAGLSAATRGGYSFAMVSTGSGSTASYGWVGMDRDKVTPATVEGWFSSFASDSRFMFTERLRPLRLGNLGNGENVPESYLSPLPSERETVASKDGTVIHSAKTGTALSPAAFFRDGRLFFASQRSLIERLADGSLGRAARGSLSGAWMVRVRLLPVLGMAVGPLQGVELAFSRGNGGLRIDGLLSTANGGTVHGDEAR